MSAILERLRTSLSGEYELERELGHGGMGTVFLARDVALKRHVAIKVLRPELATASGAERFMREARTLAALRHPGIVPIYVVGEADGVSYYVMEHVEGGTLEDRLRAGALPFAEVIALGVELLSALEAAHANGVIHRDIKPSNVFLRGGAQPILGDFGIAKTPSEDDVKLTETGMAVGTPAYMAPEQRTAGGGSGASDIYSVGMVLYEAVTGSYWDWERPPDDPGRWAGVPRRLARVLRRTLQLDPRDRWRNATEFREALARAGASRSPVPIVVAVALLAIVGIFAYWPRPAGHPSEPALADVAILPFAVDPGAGEPSLGIALAQAAQVHLVADLTNTEVSVSDMQVSITWSRTSPTDESAIARAARRDLRAQHVVRGRVTREGDSLAVAIAVIGADGNVRHAERVTGRSAPSLGFAIGHAIVRIVAPRNAARYRGQPALLERPPAAQAALIRAMQAFQAEQWLEAERHYLAALEVDSTFALAWWGLYNVRRWRRVPIDIDLAGIYAAHPEDFGDLDRLLIEADLAASMTERFAKQRAAIRLAPHDAYAWLLFGNELFHRGALIGYELDSAIAALDSAVARNAQLAPALSTLTWALIRAGDRRRADSLRVRYRQIAASETDRGFCLECFLDLAFAERFSPEHAPGIRDGILSSQTGAAEMSRAFRFAPSFGIPPTSLVAVGRLLANSPLPAFDRAGGLTAQGLGLVALGRMGDAIVHFDSAAAVLGDPAAAILAAQWRLIPGVVGMPGPDERGRTTGRVLLERLTSSAAVGARAAWTLALDAFASGDTAAARRWSDRLSGTDSVSTRLRESLTAFQAAAAGDLRGALQRSEPVLRYDVSARGGDPFLRGLIHLQRGRWRDELGVAGADADLVWTLNADLVGWPVGVAHAAEIDWAWETFATFLRGSAAASRGDRETACRLLARVAERWANAEPAFSVLRDRAAASAASCPA